VNKHSKLKREKGSKEKHINTLVDTRNNSREKNYKLPKDEVSENKRQCRTKGDKQRGILQSKHKISGDNKRKKTKSWKEYSTLITEAKPWNAVYIVASRKKAINTQITTLRKPDG